MAKNKTPPPPSPEQVEKHFQAQQKSVFQKPYSRDPGVTIVSTQGEVARIIDAAREGETVPAFKLRNTDEILADPVARTSDLLRKAHQGMEKADFAALIGSTLVSVRRVPSDTIGLNFAFQLVFYEDVRSFRRSCTCCIAAIAPARSIRAFPDPNLTAMAIFLPSLPVT